MPVLFLVESLTQIDTEAVTQLAHVDYVLASASENELLHRIETLLARAQARRARATQAEILRRKVLTLTGEVVKGDDATCMVALLLPELAAIFSASGVAITTFSDVSLPLLALRWSASNPRAIEFDEDPTEGAARFSGVEHGDTLVVHMGEGTEPLGAIWIARSEGSSRWTSFERQLVQYVARQLTSAMVQAHLTATNLATQVELQRTSDELRNLYNHLNDQATIVRSIADAMDVGIMFLDQDDNILMQNRAMGELLARAGWDPVTGEAPNVYSSDQRTQPMKGKNAVLEVLRGGQNGLALWIGPEGDQRAVITSAHRISSSDGEFLGSAIVDYDVTDFANSVRIREQFLASISHELRTPLTSIVGYIDILAEVHDPQQLGIALEVDVIQRNAEQLLTLIDDLLAASSGELRLRAKPTDLSELIRDSARAFQPRADAAHVFLSSTVPDELIADVDGARVRQVLDNLLSNAVKFTPAGGAVRLMLERDGNVAVLSVADTGRGISPADQRQLYDMFFRASSAREDAVQGVGLGLSIVKPIIDTHGGSIDVESALGHGTTFRVRLPLRSPVGFQQR